MRNPTPLVLTALILCSGCAHRAQKYAPPDATKMHASLKRLSAAVGSAKITAKKASDAVTAAKQSAAAEVPSIDSVSVRLDSLSKTVPVEFRGQIVLIQHDIETLRSDHTALSDKVEEARHEHSTLEQQLDEANAAKDQHTTDQNAYEAKAVDMTARANKAEEGWAKDSKALLWYRVHWFLGFIILGAGIVICILVSILKFTGKLAIGGSKFL
jgi:chromosome segregation ATPase